MPDKYDDTQTLIKVAADYCAGYLKHGLEPTEYDGATALVPVSDERTRIFKDAIIRRLNENYEHGYTMTLHGEFYGILHDAQTEAHLVAEYPPNFRVVIQPAQGIVKKFEHHRKSEVLYSRHGGNPELLGRSA